MDTPYAFTILKLNLRVSKQSTGGHCLRWPEPIYLRAGYVFESRFSAEMIQPISTILGILNEEWSNFKKMLSIFL